jgi:hypothetical protein
MTYLRLKAILTYIRCRKTRIVFLLSLGLFVMGMATARCILSIGSAVEVALSSEWATREAVRLDALPLPGHNNTENGI